MKAVAWVLFVGGSLSASLFGARIEPMWGPFAAGIVLAVAGAFLLRKQLALAQASGSEVGGGIRDLEGLQGGIADLARDVGALVDTEGDALKTGLEHVLLEQLMPVIEARLMLVASEGIESYARVFTPIAGAERCLNRAWSALVDNRPDVVGPQLEAAQAQFHEAVANWPTP